MVLCFLEGQPASDAQLYSALAGRGGAVGLTSPTVNASSESQQAVDISQGARISVQRYTSALGPLAPVARGPGGSIAQWNAVVARAQAAPATLIPGLLGSTVRQAQLHVGYVGTDAPSQPEAAIAADRGGGIERLSLGNDASLAARANAMIATSDLVVVRLPAAGAGLAALDRVLAARTPSELVYVQRIPPDGGPQLVPSAVFAPGMRASFSSASTRLDGVITATDLSATTLSQLRVARPAQMQGQPIVAAAGDPQQASALGGRLAVIKHRRPEVIFVSLGVFAVVLCLLALVAGSRGIGLWLRLAFLGALWAPGLCLLTAGLAPSGMVEAAVVSLGSLLLAAATDRLVPWPAGPLLPVASVVLAVIVDLAAGSPLVSASVFGPDPQAGARFYGIGNELEIFLGVAVPVATGAALSLTHRTAPRIWFFLAALLVACVVAPGVLGADAGAVVTIMVGGLAAAMAMPARRFGRGALWLGVFVVCVCLAAVAGIDVLTGGSHLTRTLLSTHNLTDSSNVLLRRLQGSASEVHATTIAAMGVCGLLLLFGARRRHELFYPLEAAVGFSSRPRGSSAFRAGVTGAVFATLAAVLANDSAPMMLIFGTVLILLSVGYVQGDPGVRHRAGYGTVWA